MVRTGSNGATNSSSGVTFVCMLFDMHVSK